MYHYRVGVTGQVLQGGSHTGSHIVRHDDLEHLPGIIHAEVKDFRKARLGAIVDCFCGARLHIAVRLLPVGHHHDTCLTPVKQDCITRLIPARQH
jgi:hypothetical protein